MAWLMNGGSTSSAGHHGPRGAASSCCAQQEARPCVRYGQQWISNIRPPRAFPMRCLAHRLISTQSRTLGRAAAVCCSATCAPAACAPSSTPPKRHDDRGISSCARPAASRARHARRRPDRALDDARASSLARGHEPACEKCTSDAPRTSSGAHRRRVNTIVRAAAPLEVVAPLASAGQRRVRPRDGALALLEVDVARRTAAAPRAMAEPWPRLRVAEEMEAVNTSCSRSRNRARRSARAGACLQSWWLSASKSDRGSPTA